MTNKSDEGLQEYLNNREKFTPEAIEAAIAEFQKRGRIFSNEELNSYRQEFQQRREEAAKEDEELWGSDQNNVVTDKDAPIYYSEKAIRILSALFGVFFGAVLLAINFRTTESKKGVWQVLTFGFTYSGLQMWVLSMIPGNSGLTIGVSMGGAYLMNYFFWGKYIGKDIKYRTKAVWKPVIIGVIIYTPILLAAIYGGAEN